MAALRLATNSWLSPSTSMRSAATGRSARRSSRLVGERFFNKSECLWCCWFSSSSALSNKKPESESKPPKILLMLAKPGGGKGTISSKILEDFPRFHHISTGDSLRQHVQDKTPVGIMAKSYMDQGKLVPDTIMIQVIMEDATPHLENGNSLLLDGFPRTLQQAQALDQVARVDLVVNLDIPTETIVARIADRWIHPGSGRIYSYSYKPPQHEGLDDETGEPLEQREDDQPEAMRKRLKIYDDMTLPLVEYYRQKKGVLKTFAGTMSDVIYPEVKTWLESKHC